jgi:3-oxoacyl-[acyl-carrier protein] reductase
MYIVVSVAQEEAFMDLQLQGKHALITGSSSGIGEGIAKELAQEGAVVLIHGRNEGSVKQVVQTISAQGGKIYAVVGDISTDEGAAQVVSDAVALVGGIDILINNAGAFAFQNWDAAIPEDWAAVYNGNVLAAVRMIRLVSRQMKNRGWGRIIQITSAEAVQPSNQVPHYAAAKAALANLTVSLSKDLARTGITVNAVSPGPITTQSFQAGYRQFAAQFGWGTDWEDIERQILQQFFPNTVGRLGRVEDIAALVAFLASPRSGYINGSHIRIDGGYIGTV